MGACHVSATPAFGLWVIHAVGGGREWAFLGGRGALLHGLHAFVVDLSK